MANKDAEEKFLNAVQAFKTADENLRANGFQKIDTVAFQQIAYDFEAAIPGIEGKMLGTALIFKANCLYWVILDKSQKWLFSFNAFEDEPPSRTEIDNLIDEASHCAQKGTSILQGCNAVEHLPWAQNILNRVNELAKEKET